MKRFFVWTFKIGSALLMSLIIWEVILRLTIMSPVPYAQDARLGWLPAPGSRGMEALEGQGILRFNEHGFRDAPIGAPIPGGTRILCLGDSYTLGAQMPEARTYPRRLEALLKQRGVENVRVFNAGRAGTTLAFSVGLARQYREVFAPDWTVIQVRDGWIENFNRDQEVHFVEENGSFAARVEWHWDTMSPRMKQLIRWHIRDIAIFQYGNRHLTELRKGGSGIQAEAPEKAKTPVKVQSQSYLNKGERELRSIGWAVSQLKAKYPHLILVHMPDGSLDFSGLRPPSSEEQELVTQCRRQNVPLITMRQSYLRDVELSHQVPIGFANTLPWQGHPNRRAHALVAQALANELAPHLNPR